MRFEVDCWFEEACSEGIARSAICLVGCQKDIVETDNVMIEHEVGLGLTQMSSWSIRRRNFVDLSLQPLLSFNVCHEPSHSGDILFSQTGVQLNSLSTILVARHCIVSFLLRVTEITTYVQCLSGPRKDTPSGVSECIPCGYPSSMVPGSSTEEFGQSIFPFLYSTSDSL
ncbi:hypothetical protein Tco_0505741 [Tanacetum coccineum]